MSMGQSKVEDLRERCPMCNKLAPEHTRWCITPVIQGETTMETRKIEGVQSVVLKKGFFF